MERITYVYAFIVTFIIVLSVVSIYLMFSSNSVKVGPFDSLKDSGNSEIVLGECNSVMYSGEEAVNLVFFSAKEAAQEYSDFLLETKPFNNYPSKFNVFTISDYEPECEYYKGIAILCYSKELVRKASSCPNDYIIVLKEENSYLRSSAYLGVMSLNTNHPLTVFLHEFGHTFANFAEEYLVEGGKIPRGSENCVEECEDFGGIEDGCFKECTTGTHYRSIDEGVMRTLSSSSYGLFNEYLLTKKIDESVEDATLWYDKVGKSSKVTLNAIALENVEITCSEKEHILVGVRNGKKVSEEKVNGCANNGGAGDYSVNLKLKDGQTIEREINPVNIWIDGPEGEGEEENGAFEIEDTTYYIGIPVSEKIVGADVVNSDGKIEFSIEDPNKFLRLPCLVE